MPCLTKAEKKDVFEEAAHKFKEFFATFGTKLLKGKVRRYVEAWAPEDMQVVQP